MSPRRFLRLIRESARRSDLEVLLREHIPPTTVKTISQQLGTFASPIRKHEDRQSTLVPMHCRDSDGMEQIAAKFTALQQEVTRYHQDITSERVETLEQQQGRSFARLNKLEGRLGILEFWNAQVEGLIDRVTDLESKGDMEKVQQSEILAQLQKLEAKGDLEKFKAQMDELTPAVVAALKELTSLHTRMGKLEQYPDILARVEKLEKAAQPKGGKWWLVWTLAFVGGSGLGWMVW
jgi:chromosome segregation ATPase